MKREFDAWHLPGLQAREIEIATYEAGDVDVRAPRLTQAQLTRIIENVSGARAALLHAEPDEIVHAIDAAASLITQAKETRDLLAAATGYSSATIDLLLEHMRADWSAASLQTLLQRELPRAGAGVRITGPSLSFHIFSGNVPGVAVTSMIRALLVRSSVLGKTGAGEPVLPVLFAKAMAQVAPHIAECIAVTYWPGGTTALEDIAIHAADTAVVYGGAEAVRSVTAHASAHTRVIVHGPKLSFGVVGRDADASIAAAIARATAAYDQQGCVSPHVVYVERGGRVAARDLAAKVAAALEQLAADQPRRKLSAAEAVAIREARTRAEFRAANAPPGEVFGPDDTSFTVICDEDPALVASCLNRTLYIKPIDDIRQLRTLLEPHRAVLQSVAVEGIAGERREQLVRDLVSCGVTRISTFDRLPWPPMWWHHDGRGPLTELLFWHDIEEDQQS